MIQHGKCTVNDVQNVDIYSTIIYEINGTKAVCSIPWKEDPT